MTALTFATPDEAIRAPVKWTQRIVLVDGTPTACTDVSTQHSVNGNGIGTATLVMETPYPAHVVTGATVEVQAGYSGQVATVFSGTIPKVSATVGDRGRWGTVTGRGHLDRLSDPHPTALTFAGPIDLREIVRAILALRGVPYTLVDDITWADGSTVTLGTEPLANGGAITIPATAGLRQWLQAALALPGYRLFDTPAGVVRCQRISGLPVGDPVIDVTEGELGYRFDRTSDLDPMVTYHVVKGARYTDADGVNIEIRSIPLTVELDARLAPLGYRKHETSSDLLVSTALADKARNVLEIDQAAPHEPVSWQSDLAPHIQPGDVATVTSATVGAVGDLWITDVAHTMGATGLKTTTFDGIRGNGEALPAGQDCIEVDLFTGPYHLGDEAISWYKHPAPQGKQIDIPFTVPDDYSSMSLAIRLHSTNSYMLGGKNADSTVSKVEFWQGGEKIGETVLPVLAENYGTRPNYAGDPSTWQDKSLPVTGSIKAGAAIARLISGADTRLPSSTRYDDYELEAAKLRLCGVGEPVFIDLEVG